MKTINKYINKKFLLILIINILFMNKFIYATSIENNNNINGIEEDYIENEILDQNEIEETEETENINELNNEIFGHADNVGDITEFGYELVWTDGTNKIFYDSEYDLYEDINGTISKEELQGLDIDINGTENSNINSSTDIIETLAQNQNISLNVTTVFDNLEIEDSTIYNILLSIDGEPTYDGDEEVTTHFDTLNLSRENNFTNNITFETNEKNFVLSARIPTDITNVYNVNIKYNNEEKYTYSSENNTYNIEIHVMKPEYTIDDTNLAPSLSSDWNYVASGQYAESRAEELGYNYGKIKESTPSQIEDTKETINVIPIIIIGSILIIIIIGGIVYIKKLKEDEDE